jgi:autotransporter-associated beta strand protein
MTFASFARTTGASVLFRGTSFGTAAAANVSTLLFTTAPVSPALAGAAGAANTTTASILKGAFGDNSLSGTGTDMVTYNLGNTNGLRLLNGAGFSGEYSTTLTTNTNVKLTADVAASTVNINSLILNGFNITNPGSPVTVTISNGGSLSGNILINSATNIAGANTTIGITTSELNILATASSTISAIIGTATTGSLTLSGPGNVTLSAANPFTGLTSVNDATLTYGTSNILSSGGVTIVGGTLAMGTSSDTVGAVILQNGSITGSSGILTGASYSFREGTVSAIIAGAVTVTVIATNAAPDAVVTLSGSNTYTGATTVTSGILKLGATGDATNTPLGTTDAGTTIASGAMLDLNGFTLGTAEGLTISGSGIGSGLLGALMNSSASTPTYSGAIILGAAARISADAGVMTISGGISSGGAFTITIGGFSDSTFSGALTTGSLTKDGIGTLTLSNGNSSYPGTTTINAGTIKLGAVSVGGTNSPLGTIGGITTVAIGARLDLNGINLGIAEPLTINGVGYGLGDFASGALINSSPSAVIFSGPTTMASASTIKANSGDITLSGANSGAFALTLGGTGNGILSGTIASSAATVTKIDTGTWTLSGASNAYTGTTSINLGTLKIGAAGVTTSPLGTVVGTTVYSGAVLNLNGFALGIAEALTLNGRGINDGGALINSGGATTFLGAITLGTDSRITNSGSGLLTLSGGVTNGGFALYVGGTNSTTFNTVAISGTGSLVKQDSGTVTNNVSSTYTGATRIDAGTFAYGASGLLAVTNVAVTGGIWDMGTIADSVGTVTLIGGTIQNGTLTGTGYTLENGTISAILAGAIAVVKNTNNTVTLTNANTISSTTTINAGTLTLSGVNGTAVSTTITVNYGGTLTLDNSGSGNSNTNRLGDLALTMNGGNFNFLGSANAVASETWATQSLVLNSGHNVVTLTSGAGGSTTVTFAGITRTAAGGATVLFRGTNLGSNAGAGNTNLIFTTATNLNLTGGAGAAGSATIKIVPYAMGDTSATGTGFGFVTYNIDTNGNVNGIRPLTLASEYDNTNTPATSSTTNVRLTANYAPNANRDWNSLLLEGGVTYTVGSNASRIMTITSGAIGSTGAANTITGGATDTMAATATVTEFKTQLVKDLTISVVIANTNTPALTLGFGGTLTLSKANLNSGITTINTGKLYYGITDALLSGNVFIVGGTLDMTGGTYTDTIGALSLNAGTVATGASTLTGNGSFTTIANNNVASIITGKLGLGNNATFTIADGTTMDNDAVISAVISGAFTFAKAGTGVLEVSGSNTYSGATTISAGIFRLGATGDATNTPLGTIAAGTTVSGATSALDLNGFSLGTAEALTLSGAWANGALQNNSSAPVNYSGLITLGAASTIISNYGDINITNTGNITGATFALTIGGAGNGTLVSNLNTTTGTLTKNGLGLWIIGNASTGLSTFTGLTTISAGTLKLGYGGNGTNTPIGTNAGGITISTTGIFDLNGFTLGTAEPIGSLNGTGIANIGAFINSSNNSITYTGAITMAANSTIANYGSGVLTLTGAISGSFALTVVTVGGVTQSSASVWSGTGTLVKQGSGTLILAGQNTMTGAMTVSTGVLQLGADGTASSTSGPLGSIAGGVTVSSGAVLDLSTFTAGGLSTWEPLTLSGSGDLNGGALISNSSTGSTFATVAQTNARVVNNGSGTLTFTAAVTGASTFWVGGTGPTTISGALNTAGLLLTKYGSGTLTLSNASNINTSLVRINGGKLAYGVADALSTPAVTVAGGIWDLNGWNETNIGAVTLIDGSIVNTGVAATLTSTATSVVENGTISAVLGSAVAAGIAKNTAGRVTISGNNTFTSTSIALNAGYLNLQNSNALGASGTTLTTTISAGATLELQNNITLPSTKLITANGTGVNNTGAIRNVADSNTIGANITLGTTNVRINSDSGTLSFPTISGGTFNLIFGGASNISVTGIISTTSGTLTKDGAGTLTLSGVNTYTGTTTIIGGIINANLTTALGDGSVTNTLIFNGGTLQAAGTIISPSNRTVILASGGGTIDTNGNSVSIAGTVGQAGGLTETGAGTLTISGVTTLGGDLTISSGTFVAPASLTIKGNFSNSGTFTHNNGTVTLVSTNSTKTTNIIGSSNTTFYNLTDTTAGSTLQLKAGNTYTFTNILTLTGSNGNPISINSDTPSAQWLMTLSGSSSISYVKVKDSGCNGGNNVGASSNIYDYGNNGTCWSFISAAYYGGGSGSVESPSTPDTQNGSGSGGGAGGGNDGSGTPDTQNGGGSNGGAGGGDLGFIYSTRDLVFIDKPSSTLDCLLM